jgi:hypothetical protein
VSGGLNLHALVRGAINSVNPDVLVVVLKSTGWTVAADGEQVPAYAAPVSIMAQVQPLTSHQLKQVDNLNQSSTYRNFYLQGDFSGLERATGKGGDVIQHDGKLWFVDSQPETWATGWTLVRGVLQVDEVPG